MKTATLFFGLLLLLVAGQTAQAAAITIAVGDNFYSPQTVTIHAGDVVTWQYGGGTHSHPTASDNGAWATFTINTANPSQSMPFPTVGTFAYHCSNHGAPGSGMFGVITVAAALAVQPGEPIAAAFRLYPNPASAKVTLLVDPSQARAPSAVVVVNALGDVMRTFLVRPDEVGLEVAVSVADLPAGIYYYRLLRNGRVVGVQRLSLVR